MIVGLTWLLACQLLGEVVVRLTGLPVPGPVVGMVLLFALLRWRHADDEAAVVRTADALLSHLQLFFVPAGVGVIAYLTVLRHDALPLGVALVGSWVAGIAVVGGAISLLARRERT